MTLWFPLRFLLTQGSISTHEGQIFQSLYCVDYHLFTIDVILSLAEG